MVPKNYQILVGALLGIGLMVVFLRFPTRISENVIKEQIPSQTDQKIRGPCNDNVYTTLRENIEIENCIPNFPKMRQQRGSVNGPKMETERVNGHSYLTGSSRVLEVGGFTGKDAAKLITKYDPYYTALEPVPRFQRVLEERYKNNPKFKLLKFGLGREDKNLTLNINTDATSLFRGNQKPANSQQETVQIREITKFFRELDIVNKPIDLLTINCEGCEFELLELLITNHIVDHLRNIQFQFHINLPGITNQECRYCQIMTLLSRTHRPSFQYLFVWQSWHRKDVQT